MKITKDELQQIISLKAKGFGSRYIAYKTGYSKSAINNWLKKWKEQGSEVLYNPDDVAFKQHKPRVLFLDIETSADIVATFGRFKQNISESNVVIQGNQIICAAYKFLNYPIIHTGSSVFWNFEINHDSEKHLIQSLIEAMKKADIVVAHNANFDLGTIQHRALVHGLGRLPSVKVVDTLQIAKKYLKLRSNKLDSITKYFGLTNKLENSGIRLWIDVQRGSVAAMEEMLEYNKQDVKALEDVYNMFVTLPQGVSATTFSGLDGYSCTSCGSKNVQPTGRKVNTSLSSFSEYECMDCGARMRDRINTLTKEQRKNILMPV